MSYLLQYCRACDTCRGARGAHFRDSHLRAGIAKTCLRLLLTQSLQVRWHSLTHSFICSFTSVSWAPCHARYLTRPWG